MPKSGFCIRTSTTGMLSRNIPFAMVMAFMAGEDGQDEEAGDHDLVPEALVGRSFPYRVSEDSAAQPHYGSAHVVGREDQQVAPENR